MRWFTCLLVTLLVTQPIFAQNSSALINEALDKQVKLELNTTLPQAMKGIAKDTGVPVRAAPQVWELLPWGEQTNITAKIENQTLREALAAITKKLGLTFVLKDESVELQPMSALARLGRRSTVQELQALDVLTSNELKLDTDRPTVRQLTEAVDKKLEELKSPFAIENRADPESLKSDQQVFVARNATLADALDVIDTDTKATWYPWGKSIVIIDKEDRVRARLAKEISTRYNGVDVSQVLMELSQRAGVEFSIEPGAVQRIAPEFRNVRLILDNATIQTALETLAGFTGLGYVVNDRGVYIWNQSSSPGGGAGGRDPIVGMLQLDNGMQVVVKESQVTPDIKEYLRHKTAKELDKIKAMMQEEGFKPTTQPAAPPAQNQDL